LGERQDAIGASEIVDYDAIRDKFCSEFVNMVVLDPRQIRISSRFFVPLPVGAKSHNAG
jgi:hypothetical protein